jgi:hypothetical protein
LCETPAPRGAAAVPSSAYGGVFEQLGMVPAQYRPAGLTAAEIALAREQVAAQREREAFDRAAAEREATRRREAESEGRVYTAVSSGITQAGELARTGITSAAQTEQERIRAARDESIARINRDAEAERTALRRAELERLPAGYASTSDGVSSSSSSSSALVIAAVIGGGAWLLSQRRGGRGRRRR